MNIRPKDTILFAQTGVKFSQNNLGGANWRQQVFNNYRQHLLDQLSKYGEARDYGDWLNEMQSRHANIYKLAGGEKGNWENVAYKNDLVGQYQHDYKGDKRFGTTKLKDEDTYDFNQGITPNFNTRYNIANPPSRVSGDNSAKKFNVDSLYSAITDDRRLLGRKGDWDESSTDFKQWQNDLKSRGWETYLDTNDNYYKLRRLAAEPDKPAAPQEKAKVNEIPVGEYKQPESIWTKLGQGLNKVAPDLLDALRLAGNMYNNDRVYKESMKAIRPNLQQSYHTYRQVVGDEATKQGFYRRAVQGEQRAARPITSDLDKQIAYQNEAKRIGDELRAQGDLADNQRIRETSQESMAHADANTERDTTVANSNLTEILKADAAKHQLTAQKYSADWTNLEQYLMGRQYKLEQKKAEQKELERQLALLDTQEGLLGNTELRELRDIADKDYNAYINYSGNDENEKAALKNKSDESLKRYQLLNIKLKREALKQQYGGIYSAKEGTKITKKHKDTSDKFLYKTSRDIVEHFRKMSKMTDDSRIKTLPKPIKLTSHPRKMQLGGVAPFTVYRPLGVGGENAVSTQTSSSTDSKSSKDTAAKDKLDMIKELFKQVQGLPIDVSRVYQEISGVLNKAKAFGDELTTDDIASMYLNVMNRMSQLKYSQDSFNKAKAQATSNEALNEIAVGVNGEMVLQDADSGKIKIGTISDWIKSDKKLNPLTNDQILELRAKSPNMVFNDDILGIVNNGVGMNKISAQIKSLAASVGSSTEKLEGISQVESNRIKAGIQILSGTAGTPDGFYKVSTDAKDSSAKINAALNYIYSMLPKNYKTLLEIHSDGKGKELIANFLNSQTDDYVKQDITPLTGKTAKDANGNTGGKGGTDTPASVQFLLGNGYSEVVDFNIGNSQSVKALGRFGILQDKDKNNLGQGSTLQDVSKSQFGPILDLDKATFGGTRLTSGGYSHIILNNSDCVGVDLPVKKDLSGNYVPDFQQLASIEKAEEKIQNNKITDPQQINKIYEEFGLPNKYDSNGNIITQNYRRFAGIQVILDSKALRGGTPININEVSEANDEERELFIEEMKKSGNKDYDLSDGILWSSWGRDKLYKGTIFVPVREDIVAGYTSGGQPLDTDLPNNANQVTMLQYAPKTQQYQKTPPLSSLK